MTKKILVVDDEQDILHTLEMILTLEGHEVTLAIDGQQGLERLTESQPDLIISDIMMPIMDGIEMVEKIRADPTLNNIPIIILSAIQPDLKPQSAQPWNLFIKKPPDLEKLLKAINHYIA